jgi:SAM-dependent methyltransferase
LRLKSIYSITDNVEFRDDDICKSSLEPNSFDVVCSWEVLEHLHDPKQAFNTISKLLKIGGISIHYYNPFFCINGGHSLSTLDFLWGHVRLNEQDVIDYIEKIRPNETERAISFYKNGVNRMTLTDLENILSESEMKVLDIIPFTKEQHLRMVDEQTLTQSMNNYPNIKLLDLAAPAVLVITQRVK